MHTPRELQALFHQGENITQLLRSEHGVDLNTGEIIETAYDLQTGSYVAGMNNPQMVQHKQRYAAELVGNIKSLCNPSSILEAGVGEGTTLSFVLSEMVARYGAPLSVSSFGFDLSWSRVAYARQWLHSQGLSNVTLCTGDLFNIPVADNAIDVVYTSHSIEPNGGNEKPILQELYRITGKYLILLEPGYELAGPQARERMESHGYCRNLQGLAEELGYDVLQHQLFPVTTNPLNPTAITIIRKREGASELTQVLACPKFKSPLQEVGNMLFSPE